MAKHIGAWLAGVLVATAAACPAPAQVWEIETVAPSGNHADLALDSDGRPHILFDNCTVWEHCDPTGPRALTYGVRDAFGWTFETVADDPAGFHLAIVVDPADAPRIAYCDTMWRMHYGVRGPGGWALEDLAHEPPRYYRASPSLALDAAGEPHIAFIERERVHYAHRVGGLWTDATVDGSWLDNFAARAAIAVDSADSLRIGTRQYYSSAVLLTLRGGAWDMDFVGGTRGYNPWMVLDAAGAAHMTYHGGGTQYATNASGAWVEEVIDTYGADEANDIAMGPDGRPVVVYTRATLDSVQPWMYDLELVLARKNETGWTGEVVVMVPGSLSVSVAPRLEIDQEGAVHVLYRSPHTDELVYARRTGVSGVPHESVPPSAGTIRRIFPNPFNPATEVVFDLPRTGATSLTVYDLGGRRVRELFVGPLEAGKHRFAWDGRTAGGRAAPSGVYLFRLVTPGGEDTRRAVLLK